MWLAARIFFGQLTICTAYRRADEESSPDRRKEQNYDKNPAGKDFIGVASESTSVVAIPERKDSEQNIASVGEEVMTVPKNLLDSQVEAAFGRDSRTSTTVENEAQHSGNSVGLPEVPPLTISTVHTPMKADVSANDTPTATDFKWSRTEHEREMEELKTEIHLIRSRSKKTQKLSDLSPFGVGSDFRPDLSPAFSSVSTSKSKESPWKSYRNPNSAESMEINRNP